MRVGFLVLECALLAAVGCVPGPARGPAARPPEAAPGGERSSVPPPERRFTFAEIARDLSAIPIGFDEAGPALAQRTRIRERVEALRGMGFRGRIRVEGHAPDHCLRPDAAPPELAPADWPLRRCTFASAEYSLAIGVRTATAVKKLLVEAGLPAGAVSTVSYGMERPLVSQPDPESPEAEGWTAGRWNHAAHANRRVSVLLEPAADFVECRAAADCPEGATCREGACERPRGQ